MLAGLTGAAVAGTSSATFPATATVVPACAVSAANLQFANVGNISSASGFAGSQAQTTISLACNDATLNATVELDKQPMVNATDGTTVLAYNLFQDASLTTPWGTTAQSEAKTLAATYGIQSLTVYGQIPAQPNVVAGAYAAPVNVTVSY
jgi:spore coat protein U-like protein